MLNGLAASAADAAFALSEASALPETGRKTVAAAASRIDRNMMPPLFVERPTIGWAVHVRHLRAPFAPHCVA